MLQAARKEERKRKCWDMGGGGRQVSKLKALCVHKPIFQHIPCCNTSALGIGSARKARGSRRRVRKRGGGGGGGGGREGEKDKCALAQGEKITAVPTRVLLLLQDSCWKHRRHYHSGHADPNRATQPRREAGAHAKGVDGSSKKVYFHTHLRFKPSVFPKNIIVVHTYLPIRLRLGSSPCRYQW